MRRGVGRTKWVRGTPGPNHKLFIFNFKYFNFFFFSNVYYAEIRARHFFGTIYSYGDVEIKADTVLTRTI